MLHQELLPVDDFCNSCRSYWQEKLTFCRPVKYRLGEQVGIHKFLYMPGSPKLLFWQDSLEQMDAKVNLNKTGAKRQTILTDGEL